MDRFTVISGCSGGGKSTLLAELAGRGFGVVEEPGRRIVEEETVRGSTRCLPWVDPAAFAARAVAVALEDLTKARALPGQVFFDRGLVDAAAALAHFSGVPLDEHLPRAHRYGARVFLTPPWPEIFATDSARRHGLDAGIAEYERLLAAYPALGYQPVVLPKSPVAERADFVLAALGAR